MSRIVANSDFLSGLLFMLCGGGFVLIARGYDMGTAVQMGPGYLPVVLGCGVVLVGVALCVKAMLSTAADDTGGAASFHIRPSFFVLGSMVVFGITLRPLGIILATALMVIVASLASSERRNWEVVLLASGLAVFSALIFVKGLGVPMPIWPRGF